MLGKDVKHHIKPYSRTNPPPARNVGTNIAQAIVMVTRSSRGKGQYKTQNSNPSAWGHLVEVKLKCLSIRSGGGLWGVLAVTTCLVKRKRSRKPRPVRARNPSAQRDSCRREDVNNPLWTILISS
jgi:hypothetical protein